MLARICRRAFFDRTRKGTQLRHLGFRRTLTTPTALDLTGKKCVITGGSGAIGLATASLFVQHGASVQLIGRSAEKLEHARSTILKSQSSDSAPDRIAYSSGDITDIPFWESFASSQDSIDILVNAAGVTQNKALRLASADALWDIVDINLVGSMFACKHLAKKMTGSKKAAAGTEDRHGGVIVNVGSLLGARRGRGAVAYAASKAGIVGLTRALADEFASSGIRVNAVVPGYIKSEMTQDLPNVELLTKSIPVRRFGEPSEVADAIAFLVANQYANSCVLNLDGGLSATM